MVSNNAVICLTRGYSNLEKYNELIMRNVSIWKAFNQDLKYPLVIFHEGNITEAQQVYISDKSMGQNLIFKDISSVWTGGYEGMCRFMIYDIWEQCKQYDYVMRIDEDCIIERVIYDPFSQIENAGLDYFTSVWWAESHTETNQHLPKVIQDLTGADPKEFYNDRYPYTNVSLAKVSFMRGLKELKLIAENPLQRKYRFGDLPAIGALLNIYAKDKVGTLAGLSYYHASHNASIICE